MSRKSDSQSPGNQPPVGSTPGRRRGPWVYFPKEEWRAVTQELVRAYPPGTAHWGTNESKWKRGHWYVLGEDSIPTEAIVRRTVVDEESVEVLPFEQGAALESERPSNTSS
jgi:hypothetical protein